MAKEKDIQQLTLSKDSPEGVLHLPDNRCLLHLRHVTEGNDQSFEVRKDLEQGRKMTDTNRQWEDVRVILHQILTNRFRLGELQTLCFYLGVEYENLSAEAKSDLARDMVIHLEHRDRLFDLVRRIKQVRPDVHRALPSEVIRMVQPPPRVSDSQFARQRAREYKTQPGLR